MKTSDVTPEQSKGWSLLLVEGRLARFALICLGIWLNAADSLMTATIMPSVAADIGGYAYFAWTIAGFILGAILAGATAGQVSLRLGLRSGMGLAACVYVAGCIVSALASNIEVFLIGRLLQGIGAGWIVGLCYVAIGTVFPEVLWPRVLASVSGVWGGATLLSPLIGGLFAESGHWRWAFWFFAVQGVGFAGASYLLLSPVYLRDRNSGLPLVQLMVLTIAIVSIAVAGLLPDVGWAIFLGTVGLGILLVFTHIDARSSTPLLPRSSRNFLTAAGSGFAMIFTMAASAIAFSVYGAAIMQAVYGLSPLTAGYILAIESMAWTVAALCVAGLGIRWEGVFIKLGSLSVLTASLLLALALGTGPLLAVCLAATLLGGGFGFAWAFVTRRIIVSVPESERALASAAVPTMQMIGYATGSALAGVIANFLGFANGIDARTAEAVSFWLFAGFVPVAMLAVLASWRLASRDFD